MADCIFCKIALGEIPCAKIYEDDLVLSFLDINPINPGHTLVLPKKHYTTLLEIDPDVLEACVLASQKIAKAIYTGVKADGLNFLQNNFRAAGQLIDHVHFHLIPRYENDGFLTAWPGRQYPSGEMESTLKKIVAEL
ncbi:MAG: HIT family protein [Desulforhabdus sp.]|jgi:histidine triad (HIT) family protein|nr:HIT family protein [Desulforhabdus sp.]